MYYSSKDSNAYFLERIQRSKSKIEKDIHFGVLSDKLTPKQKIKALHAKGYYLWSKEKRLQAREEILNQNLNKWLRHY